MPNRSETHRRRVLKQELGYFRKDASRMIREIIGDADRDQIADTLMVERSTLEDKIRTGRFKMVELLLAADICGKVLTVEDKHPDLRR